VNIHINLITPETISRVPWLHYAADSMVLFIEICVMGSEKSIGLGNVLNGKWQQKIKNKKTMKSTGSNINSLWRKREVCNYTECVMDVQLPISD